MKTVTRRLSSAPLPLLSLALIFNGAARAADTPPSPQPEMKTHVLFVGADLSVEKDKKLYRVQNVAGDNFIVTVNNQPVRVSTDKDRVAIKVDQHMQLTDLKATLADLKGDRAYSFGGDPIRRRSLESVEMMTAMQEATERSNIQAGIAENKLRAANNLPSQHAGREAIIAQASSDLQSAERANQTFAIQSSSDFATGREQMRQAALEHDKELYDAIEIKFTVSSPERLGDAYVVVIARIRDPDSRPGAVRNWIYAKSIGAVTNSPSDIHIKHAGFPPGFVLEGFDVHLYSGGHEVATNVSPKRVELTQGDAAQYTLIEYLTSHKEATLPPSPAVGRLPKDYHEHLGGPTSPKVCFVKVDQNGVPVEIYTDPSCSEKLDDGYIASVLKQIWFKPALQQGKPVEGIAKVKLTSLRME